MPWITKNPSQASKVLPFFFVSLLIMGLHSTSSPKFLRKEKERTLVGRFFFRYFLFSSFDLFSLTKAIEREYSLPKMSFFNFVKRIDYFDTALPSLRKCSISRLFSMRFKALFFALSLDSFLKIYRAPLT